MLPFVCPKVVSFVFCGAVVLGRENNAGTWGVLLIFLHIPFFLLPTEQRRRKDILFVQLLCFLI